MKRFLLAALLVRAFSLALTADDDHGVVFSANLSTFNEVPPKANGANGTFRAKLSEDGTTLNWTFLALNMAPNDQALNQHDFAGFLDALRHGSAYANMHTTRFLGGEIRGQIAMHRGDDDRDDR